MKKLLFITLVLAALLPVELWAQSTTGGDDGSDTVAAPTFRFDGDYLVIETATEDASIFYQMADLPDMSDETIEKVSSSITVTANIDQSNYYEQPIELKKSVVLKAIAAGATESEVSVLVYDYDSWHKLQEAIEYGEKIQSLAQDNANVDEDLKEQLKWILYESMHFYEERAMMPYQEAQHFTNHIFEICAQIEQQMSGQATAEPYAVLSENNTVLTFYYDDQKAARNGMGVGPFSNSAYQSWYDQRESITSVVFDALFANCTTISSTAYWFFECKNLSTITDVKNLKTDNVTDMRWMFYGCSGLTSLDLSHFETSNVTDMGLMFYGCSGLTNLDLSHFNTSNVTDMSVMFSYCSSLTSLDVSHFETSNVTDIGMMFYGCSALVNIFGNNWDLSKLESGSMVFGNCTSLVGGAGTVYNANHTDYTYAHIDGGPSNPGYFTDKNAPVIAETEPYAVLSDNNTVLTFYYDEKKNERNGMGVGPFELVYVDGQPTANSDWFSQREKITEVVFDESFANATTLTSTALWFYKCEKLTKISGIHYLYTANVTDMNHMFGGCRLLVDLDLSNFNTANVKNLDGMFSEAGFTDLDLRSFDTSNVTDMYGLFWGTTGLKNVDLSSFNTSSVTTMRGMFNYCWNLTNIDLSNFDTSNATDIAVMFNECSGLTSLDLSNFKTDNVEEMTYMFRGCSHLTNVDLSSFNTGNVTYMINMFEGCTSLTTLDLSSFNTAKLKYVSQMFKGCSALNTIYVGSEWTTNNIETSNEMFSGCTNLIGGKGTHYNANHTDYTYAHIDGGPSNPGYFTAKDAPVIDATFDSNGVLTIGSGTTMTDALEAVGGRAEVAKTITAIVWNNETELTDADLQGLDNPNMLIYVTNESLAPQNRNNIITYDFAKNIVLTDVSEGNGNFYCPQEFKAETITYSHEYNQTTEIDVARGWESIALPFTVQTITHETKGQIAPFGSTASGKHFWLRQLTENGLARATVIEPNTAYLISMPNSNAYYADFNLNGRVTFSSQDVWVPKTQIHAVDYHTEKGMVVLLPNFQRRASDYTTYALNVGEQRGDYPEGSVFEREYRDIRPFEAYTFHQGGAAPRFLPISDLNGDDATGIEEVRSLRAEGRGDVWYDMSGRRLQQKPAGKGVYILNGRKVVIK